MAGVAFSVSYEDFGASRSLAELSALGGDLRPILGRVGLLLEQSTRERFDTGRAPDGAAWVPSKRARDKGGKTLADTGRLLGSITHQVEGEAVEIGSNVAYAAVHQFGRDEADAIGGHTRLMKKAFGRKLRFPVHATVKPYTRKTRIPARPYLGLSAGDRADVLEAVGAAIGRALARGAPS